MKRAATAKQINAYREIKRREHERHMITTYGMLPIGARHVGVCGCKRHDDRKFGVGDKIVKFRGAWWLTYCVDETLLDEFRASCRYVFEVRTRKGWQPFRWSADAKEFALWQEEAAIEPREDERAVDRQNQTQEVA